MKFLAKSLRSDRICSCDFTTDTVTQRAHTSPIGAFSVSVGRVAEICVVVVVVVVAVRVGRDLFFVWAFFVRIDVAPVRSDVVLRHRRVCRRGWCGYDAARRGIGRSLELLAVDDRRRTRGGLVGPRIGLSRPPSMSRDGDESSRGVGQQTQSGCQRREAVEILLGDDYDVVGMAEVIGEVGVGAER